MIDLGINLFQEIAALGGGGGFNITNSLRFNDNDSAYLSWTPSSAGNRKTWTFSAWVKLGNSGATRTLFAARLATSNSDSLQVYLTSNDQINVGGVSYGITATPVLRDPSGWYHIVLSYDTTQATDTNRAKIYINGIQASVTGTYPSINLDTPINNTQAHNLGRRPTENDRYFDGYMAEVNFIDGQALTADDFGQIDATTGEWSPKKYSGTYGTNGFYLAFEDSAALGDDTSGNTNDWTPTNLASTDQMLDTPTNNFATLNPNYSRLTLSEGNLEAFSSASAFKASLNTIGVSSGKWYVEYTPVTGNGDRHMVGVTTDPIYFFSNDTHIGAIADGWAYYGRTGDKYNAGQVSYGSTFTNGDIIGIALDMDAGTLTFYKNNVSQGVAFTGLTGEMFIGTSMNAIDGNHIGVMNYGQDSSFAGNKTRQGNTDDNGIGDFYYTPPTGYLALCENNLPTSGVVASGGTETTVIDGGRYYKVHTFTSSDTLTVTSGGEVEYLVVAGGGSNSNGGGGGGGYRSSVVGEPSGGGASAEPKHTVSAGSYTVTIGAGGSSSNGSNSAFDTIVSIGGGLGGGPVPNSGGSGGGGGISSVNRAGASGTSGQGFQGGNNFGGNDIGGGGGGAGQAGGNAVYNVRGGNGGNGVESSIDGTPTYRAGGGPGFGYLGKVPGTAGLGGADSVPNSGGPSGSGIVIIRYTV